MAQTTAKKAKAPAARTSPKAEKSATAAQKSATAAQKSATAAQKIATTVQKSAASVQKSAVVKTADLSEEVLKSVESGQRAAIAAVRKFVDALDEALPAIGDRPSRREIVIDAALDMADKLVAAQYDFLRQVVHEAAASTLSRPDTTKT